MRWKEWSNEFCTELQRVKIDEGVTLYPQVAAGAVRVAIIWVQGNIIYAGGLFVILYILYIEQAL